MAATFTVRHLHWNEHSIGTVKALYPKIASLLAPSIFNLFTLLPAGRVLQPMHGYTTMLGQRIYTSPMGNFILPMQDSLWANSCSFPTVGQGIILKNGAVLAPGMICSIFGIVYLYNNYRPVNKEELFNLCHASLCNVIKQIFGVLKWCFRILLLALEYNLHIQACIPVALSTIHNFICTHEPGEEALLGSPPMTILVKPQQREL